jgi:catalase
MRSFQSIAVGIAFSALIVAGATCAGAEGEPLGVRLVNQMNALYGPHPGVRANQAKGAVFEGMFTPAQGAYALSSAVFLKGAPTPLVIRFSNAGAYRTRPTPTLRPTVSAAWRSSSVSRMGASKT